MAATRNRIRRGSDHHRAKISEADVRLIRELLAERDFHRQQAEALSCQKIAEKFDLHPETVRHIGNRNTWVHVT